MKWLNPGYKRKSTGPVNHQGNIVLPVGHAAHFESQLAQLPKHLLHQHIISAGETLGIISQMYDTDVAFLKELNNLSSDLIYAGNVLMVPLHSGVGRNSVAATNYELDQQTFAN